MNKQKQLLNQINLVKHYTLINDVALYQKLASKILFLLLISTTIILGQSLVLAQSCTPTLQAALFSAVPYGNSCNPGSVTFPTDYKPSTYTCCPMNITLSGGSYQNGIYYAGSLNNTTCGSPTMTVSFSRPVTVARIGVFSDFVTSCTVVTSDGQTQVVTISPQTDAFSISGYFTSVTLTPTLSSNGQYSYQIVGVGGMPVPDSASIPGTITASASSTTPGSTVNISGTGWTGISGGQYKLLFDGNLVAQQATIYCTDQPSLSFDIPCGASAGSHTITCNQTTSSKTINFNVTASPISSLTTSCSTPKINSVVLEKVNSLLDTNPNAGGGLRIFPDKDNPNDMLDKRVVKVKALTSLGAGQTVYFKSFDLDDPSTDDLAIDRNFGDPNDNRGLPLEGELNNASAITDANGVATVEFRVSRFAGDNYKVAASTDSAYLNNLRSQGIDLFNGTTKITEDNIAATAKTSPMVTVWRRVHVEVDTMEKIVGNYVTGLVVGSTPGQSGKVKTTTLLLSIPSSPMQAGRFQNGRMVI